MLRNICRLYNSQTPKIGKKFTSSEEVDKFLQKVTWSIQDYVPYQVDKGKYPSKESIEKLMRISGLPLCDIEEVQERLAKQLSFIDHLHGLPVEEGIDPNQARILERNPPSIDYETLIGGIEGQQQDASIGEVSGSWDSTQHAKLTNDKYFVLRESMLTKRD